MPRVAPAVVVRTVLNFFHAGQTKAVFAIEVGNLCACENALSPAHICVTRLLRFHTRRHRER